MTSVAQIIVDLPVQQTNQTYSYLVPEDYRNQNIIGRRVMVDFNRRKLLGFVVDQVDVQNVDLKEIDAVIDDKAILNSELLSLSKWMSDYFFSYRINSISAILPNQYKVNYLKNYQIIDEIDETDFKDIFLGFDLIPINAKHLNTEMQSKLNELINEKKVSITTEITRREKIKTAKAVSLALEFAEANDIFNSSKGINQNQKKIIEFFLKNPTIKIPVNELAEIIEVSSAVINNLIKKKWLISSQIEIQNNPLNDFPNDETNTTKELILNDEQSNAVDEINLANNEEKTFLLEGVTGSGKTEIYLRAIENVLKNNQSAIFLVPEITLTSQIVRRVKSRFNNLVGVLHSGISDTQRLYTWNKIQSGEIKVIVGTRSAVFAPAKNVGLIILDEEHDGSYKQEENPRYHARDIAKWRSKYNKIPLVLGSATPSLESRARATSKGDYQLLKLNKRATKNVSMPEVSIVDMKKVVYKNGGDTDFSPELLNELKLNKEKNKQSILLINRRGYSSFMMCRNCGYVPTDKRCSISLTVHLENHKLKCHYCGHQEEIPSVCANCGSTDIHYFGTGTQKVEETLNKIMPSLKTIRMDNDTTSKKGSADKIIRSFEQNEYDVLIGTQMVAKGLDFPNVGLVGIVNSDTSLNLPDFRASEKTFDLLTQVSGRSGRSGEQGKVVMQTFNPEHYAVQLAAKHDYESFFNREMNYRHIVGYPPYFYTVRVALSGLDDLKTSKAINEIANIVETKTDENVILVGPSSRAINKIKNRYNYQFLIKFKMENDLTKILEGIQDGFIKKFGRDIYLTIDREPLLFN